MLLAALRGSLASPNLTAGERRSPPVNVCMERNDSGRQSGTLLLQVIEVALMCTHVHACNYMLSVRGFMCSCVIVQEYNVCACVDVYVDLGPCL